MESKEQSFPICQIVEIILESGKNRYVLKHRIRKMKRMEEWIKWDRCE